MTPPEQPPLDSEASANPLSGDPELETALGELEQSLGQLKTRYAEIKTAKVQKTQLQQTLAQLQAQIQQTQEQLQTVEVQLESQLLTWRDGREWFWHFLRFAGLGFVIALVLKSVMG